MTHEINDIVDKEYDRNVEDIDEEHGNVIQDIQNIDKRLQQYQSQIETIGHKYFQIQDQRDSYKEQVEYLEGILTGEQIHMFQ